MSEFTDFRVVIPVRLDSKRLPEKALADIAGKPMIQHVYNRAIESCATSVVIATDSERVREVAEGFGATVCMTASEHESGTDRLAEAVVALCYDEDEIVVNLQGDEPLVPPQVIQQVAEDMSIHETVKLATVCEKVTDEAALFNPDVVKVVMNRRGFAIYFSRAPIPWERDGFNAQPKRIQGPHYRHIGLYAYRVGFLAEYLSWARGPLDEMESLEQLRVLWHGHRIHCVEAVAPVPSGVDTQSDLDRVRSIITK